MVETCYFIFDLDISTLVPYYLALRYLEFHYLEFEFCYLGPWYLYSCYLEPRYLEPWYLNSHYCEPCYLEPHYLKPGYLEPHFLESPYLESSHIKPWYFESLYHKIFWYLELCYLKPWYLECLYIKPRYLFFLHFIRDILKTLPACLLLYRESHAVTRFWPDILWMMYWPFDWECFLKMGYGGGRCKFFCQNWLWFLCIIVCSTSTSTYWGFTVFVNSTPLK